MDPCIRQRPLQFLHSGVGNPITVEVEHPKTGQAPQVRKPASPILAETRLNSWRLVRFFSAQTGVVDRIVVQVQAHEICQTRQVHQPCSGDLSIAEVQLFEARQTF